jgi:hypothetical protein
MNKNATFQDIVDNKQALCEYAKQLLSNPEFAEDEDWWDALHINGFTFDINGYRCQNDKGAKVIQLTAYPVMWVNDYDAETNTSVWLQLVEENVKTKVIQESFGSSKAFHKKGDFIQVTGHYVDETETMEKVFGIIPTGFTGDTEELEGDNFVHFWLEWNEEIKIGEEYGEFVVLDVERPKW